MCDQNQAPSFNPPLQSNYFFPEFNATKPGRICFLIFEFTRRPATFIISNQINPRIFIENFSNVSIKRT